MCNICGQPDYIRCNCVSAQPFCDNCEDDTRCTSKMDLQCLIYHLGTDAPSKLTCLNLPNGSTLEQIIEAIDDLVCNSFNIPFEGQNSPTIAWTPGGPAGHKPTADVIISPDAGNSIVERVNGLFAEGDGKVKVDAGDTLDYLENQIEGGSSPSGIITNTVTNVGGILQIVPTIDLLQLINAIKDQYNAEFCELVDSCKCFLLIENLEATIAPACPDGYVLNDDETLCVGENEADPTISETIVTACPTQYHEYSQYGALVYLNGFIATGEGIGTSLLQDLTDGNVVAITTNEVWKDNINDIGTEDPNYGPANRNALWSCESPSFVGTLGFDVPIQVNATKTYYVAIAADDEFSLAVDGVTVIATVNTNTYWGDGGAKFRFWHIYPITLTSGIHIISISGTNAGGPGFMAAEIYDNTLAELQGATLEPAFTADRPNFPVDQSVYETPMNLVFTTRCARASGTFSVGNATCPPGYNLDTTGGGPLVPPCQGINGVTADWTCLQVITAPFSGWTVTLVWDRIPNAIDYQVQQKLTSDPDSAYVDASTSPVANPGSGSTVSTTIPGLPSDQMTFRVRANFSDCSTDWTEVATA